MSLAVVSLSTAMICFAGHCHHALVGKETPTGEFPLVERFVRAPGYGASVLQFKETKDSIYAVHRVWLLKPAQHRAERLAGVDASARRDITGGCINVEASVYEELVAAATRLRIEQ